MTIGKAGVSNEPKASGCIIDEEKEIALKGAPAVVSEEYTSTLATIADKIRAAQARAVKAVNLELIQVYREIGRIIYEKQQTAEWGDSVVKRLATDLQNLFPGIKGFSSRNLWIM